MIPNHISEEQIIDYVNGQIKPDKAKTVKLHIESCSHCHQLYQFWNTTMNSSIDVPEGQKNEVWNFLVTKINRKKKYTFSNITKGFVIATVCALFFILGLQIGKGNHDEAISLNNNHSFVMDQKTEVYDLINSSNGSNNGYAWYNPMQREMVLYINDNYIPRNYYYTAIIETKYSTIHRLPIRLSNGKAHLYIQDDNLDEFYRIILTNDMDQNDVNSYEFRVIPTTESIWN